MFNNLNTPRYRWLAALALWFSLPILGQNENYSTAAQNTVPTHIEKLKLVLEELDENTLPHEIKDKRIRKTIGQLRSYLDIFQFVYPIYEDSDPWSLTRKLLDRGYTLLGDFKDLFDIKSFVILFTLFSFISIWSSEVVYNRTKQIKVLNKELEQLKAEYIFTRSMLMNQSKRSYLLYKAHSFNLVESDNPPRIIYN